MNSLTSGTVIDAMQNCRLSGVAVNAGGYSSTDAVHVDEQGVTIDGFSVLENGVYNLVCNNHNGELIVTDTTLTNPSLYNFYAPPSSGCVNVKLIGDIFDGKNGGTTSVPNVNVVFGADEMILANGTIEAAGGIGLDLTSADFVSVTGMNIDANGQLTTSGRGQGAGIKLSNSNTISICGNHIEGNGGVAPYSSQIYFAANNDNVDLCANTYSTKTKTDVTLRPSYVYDVANNTVLTNSHFYESAPPQAAGAVYSGNAAAILPQLQAPQVLGSDFSGLVLSNDLVVKSEVDITPGEASDSTNAALILLPQNSSFPTGGCTVDLATNGVGGLDTGSLATNTTYFYFLIGSAFGANPACMASLSSGPPTFPSSSPYVQTVSGTTYLGSKYFYNVNSLAGVAAGQTIAGTFLTGGSTTILAVGTLTTNIAGTIGSDGMTVTVSSTTNILPGMAVSDLLNTGCSGAENQLSSGGYTVGPTITGTTFTIGSGGLTPGPDCFTISGGNTITLNANATATGPESATVSTGLYRLIGALYTYTNMAATQVIPFTQDNDRFYLNTPVSGINASLTTSAAPYLVSGIPLGVSVAALGRCVAPSTTAGHNVFMFTPAISPTAPALFPTAPGYSIRTTSTLGEATTAFPYRLDTDSMGEIAAQADVTPATLQCMTDGWVFHRGG